MAEMKQLLVLRLEGQLQAWGENSKWDFRDSSNMPTKSGIVGLIGCAMGVERGSDVLVELSNNITLAIRADRPGIRFVDFQTIQSKKLMTASGKEKEGGNTILSPHAYLQDACFTVFIDAAPQWIAKIITALQAPKWCIYLGRKNCVPSRPVLADVVAYADMDEALRKYPPAERAVTVMPYECEMYGSGLTGMIRSDGLVDGNRKFDLRRVWRGIVNWEEAENVSDQD